jgi:hypothetical protein
MVMWASKKGMIPLRFELKTACAQQVQTMLDRSDNQLHHGTRLANGLEGGMYITCIFYSWGQPRSSTTHRLGGEGTIIRRIQEVIA